MFLEIALSKTLISHNLALPKKKKVVRATAQKMNFCIKDFFIKCDHIGSFLWICSHFLKKSLIENFIFCAVSILRPREKLHLCS